MIIVVYGEDTFRAQEKIHDLETLFIAKHDKSALNLTRMKDGSSVSDVSQVVQGLPFIAKKRCVVIKDVLSRAKKESDAFIPLIENVPEFTILIIWETDSVKAIEKKSIFESIRNLPETKVYAYDLLSGDKLSDWTRARVISRGVRIDPDAILELTGRVGADLWQMSQEVEKLVAYANAKISLNKNRDGQSVDERAVSGQGEGVIKKEDVINLVRANVEGEVFAFLEAVSQKRLMDVIKKLSDERQSGSSDFQLFSMLVREVRILLSARDVIDRNGSSTELTADAGLHPFVAQKTMRNARSFAQKDLVAAHSLLFRFDREMKSGGIDAELAVDLIVAKLVG